MKIQRALLSVSDKTGLLDFAKGLHQHGVELLSTGGTAKSLREAGLPVIDVSDYTGFPELFDGRVKTLQPKIHGGILFKRENATHTSEATEHEIGAIDLVCVNLYPFEQTVAQADCTLEQAIEKIDIGGPAMLRAAAKNHASVTVVVDPEDYKTILEEMESKEHPCSTSADTRATLALKTFRRTAAYDTAISNWLGMQKEGRTSLTISAPLAQELRYGDNPHQKACLYGSYHDIFEQLQGKALSYTNILDIEAATELIGDFRRPTVGILKHTNPCGVGQDEEDLRVAWQKAFETDTQAPFGGVIVMNRPLDEGLARMISQIFTDVIIAPEFTTEARCILQKKKNLRLIRFNEVQFKKASQSNILRSAPGGFMTMDRDNEVMGLEDLESKVVTKRPPTANELDAMRFAWRVVRHVKSNAIVFARKDRTLGIGAGQMSRIDSSRIAVWKAESAELDLDGSVVASDALYPFPDGLIAAAEAGATACIQPGGSVKDKEVIEAANERNIAMVFTGHRHFKH